MLYLIQSFSTFDSFKSEQDFTHMLWIVWRALDCSVKSFPTVEGVSIRPAVKKKKKKHHQGQHKPVQVTCLNTQTSYMVNRPFKIIVLHPHVSIFGVPFCHNRIPQFSGFLHVLTVESLKQRSLSVQYKWCTNHSEYVICLNLQLHNEHHQPNTAHLYFCPDLHYNTRWISTFSKPFNDTKDKIKSNTTIAKLFSVKVKSTYALPHPASCSPETERRHHAAPLTPYLILFNKKHTKEGSNHEHKSYWTGTQTPPETAPLTFAEVHTSPKVVQICLPDLHIICCLNKACIQRLFKNICTKDKKLSAHVLK